MTKSIIILMLMLLQACISESEEYTIPNDFFSIEIGLIDYDEFLEYEAHWSGKGFVKNYLLRTDKNRDVRIEYPLNGYHHIILARKIDDKFRAFYVKIEESASDYVDALEKKHIETNLNKESFETYYPHPYGGLTRKNYSRIIVDFNYDPRNLSFFQNIKFFE